MFLATAQQFSISAVHWFSEPLSYREANIDGLAKKLLLRFGGYGLKPLDFSQRSGDQLFDYELAFGLFNRSATFRIGFEAVQATFLNARGAKDAGIITDCLAGISECFAERRFREHKIDLFFHCSLESKEHRDRFLSSCSSTECSIPVGGCVLYPKDDLFGESRLLIERSLVLTDGVFINWSFQFGLALSQEVLGKAAECFRTYCRQLGIEFNDNGKAQT